MKLCSKCGETKTLDQFSKKGKGRIQSYCKPCMSVYTRARYEQNKETHKAFVRINRKARMDRIKSWVRDFKSSTPCHDCRVQYPWYVMDFDHVDGSKVAPISTLISDGYSEQRIMDEIFKCELVCANCHRERTFSRAGHSTI